MRLYEDALSRIAYKPRRKKAKKYKETKNLKQKERRRKKIAKEKKLNQRQRQNPIKLMEKVLTLKV